MVNVNYNMHVSRIVSAVTVFKMVKENVNL